MKLNKINKLKRAYSLTEVLVAMFIIVMAFIVMSPFITKKSTKRVKPHGVWECKLVNGVHVSTLTDHNGGTTNATEGPYCIFKPQPSAEEYLVTIVGGGGGGAAGTSSSYDAVSYGEPVGYKVEQRGSYDIIIIGGGGGGSARLGSNGGYGGSAGMVKVLNSKTLDVGYYILKAGLGGIAGGLVKEEVTEDNTEEETAITDSCSYTPPRNNPPYKNVCDGADGGESMIYNITNTFNETARGGYGGGKTAGSKATGGGGVASSDSSICSSRRASGMSAGEISTSTTTCKEAIEALGAQASYVGTGGNGSASEIAYPGYNGAVMIRSALFYSGGGGRSGGISFTTVKNIKEPVKVTIGKGGEGATVQDSAGNPGENSSFGYYVTAKGGNGGEIRALSSTSKTAKLDGEAGVKSPYGGNSYGAGGNGGWAYSSKKTGVSQYWGEGEDGMAGYVRVEWN